MSKTKSVKHIPGCQEVTEWFRGLDFADGSSLSATPHSATLLPSMYIPYLQNGTEKMPGGDILNWKQRRATQSSFRRNKYRPFPSQDRCCTFNVVFLQDFLQLWCASVKNMTHLWTNPTIREVAEQSGMAVPWPVQRQPWSTTLHPTTTHRLMPWCGVSKWWWPQPHRASRSEKNREEWKRHVVSVHCKRAAVLQSYPCAFSPTSGVPAWQDLLQHHKHHLCEVPSFFLPPTWMVKMLWGG